MTCKRSENQGIKIQGTYIPAPPAPQIARPTIRAFMVGAAPQTAEPTAKMTKLVQNVHLLLKRA